MMGERRVQQDALFYGFSLERHVPETHLLRAIDRFVDLSGVRGHLAPFYSETGRPSIDPELLIRMLIVGYCFGIRSERRLCEEVHLNLGYRWQRRTTVSNSSRRRVGVAEPPVACLGKGRVVRHVAIKTQSTKLWPQQLIADTGYGSAEMLNWLVNDRGIEPHIPVFD